MELAPAVTHEVADCAPTVKRIPKDVTWEPCSIVSSSVEAYDVRIISDGAIVRAIPKRFVRPHQPFSSQLWTNARIQHLRLSMQKVRMQILEGTVMPGEYLKHAICEIQSEYPQLSRSQIIRRWTRMIEQGRVRAVVSKGEVLLPSLDVESTATRVTKGRIWSEEEQKILLDVLTGSDGLLQMATIPRKVFHHASIKCQNRGVHRSARACEHQWVQCISPNALKRSKGADPSVLSVSQSIMM